MSQITETLIGQILIQKDLITQEQLQLALEEQARSRDLLGAILLRLQLIDQERLFPVLAEQMGVEFVTLKDSQIAQDVIACLPAQFATFYKVVPIRKENDELTVAMSNPRDIHFLDGLSSVVRGRIRPALAMERDIIETIRRYYGVGAETIERMMDTVTPAEEGLSTIENIQDIESDASIGRFVNQLLWQAYKDRATDIHIEPYEGELQIRYRIDGVLYDAKVPANIKHFKDSINSRIKILSNLNIAEKRLPQDGRFKVKAGETQLDLRVSFLPSLHGESIVIRILNQNQVLDLKTLGLMNVDLQLMDQLIQRPHGIIFVTGPTGSGKTTTLYSCLARVNQSERKILTIEDPVEYQLRGITQIQIHPAIGLTFAQGLRSMLRHDPDIMMVGEVRDAETAEIAIQVALTGHLVFSTLHTNDAASGITRLLDMRIEPYLLSSSVICFIAQRLVRLLCPECKRKIKPTADVAKDFGLPEAEVAATEIYEACGCESCQGTGYLGRMGIYEFLILDDEIRELIHQRASADQIRTRAIAKGMRTLREDGWAKVKTGLTTPQEVVRVTQENLV